ncbi:TnsA endonuclease N-terminal domain-containing protein [Shewanella ulleungensis]|uniref:TnsA endonuclease N-terminal domain-containing protein n=1 Tax=Shewanella ulleungensis TaxID=2282699 RepID=UPI003D796632
MRERKLARTSKIMPRIHFCSIKNDASRFCDSELEAARLLQLEFDDDVIAYNTQPASWQYSAYGKQLRYTTDIIVEHKIKGIYFEEVKVAKQLEIEKLSKKFKILKALFYKHYQCSLDIITEEDIYIGDNIINLTKLYRFKKENISDACISLLNKLPSKISYAELIEFMKINNCAIYDPLALIAKKIYQFDIHTLLNPSTTLELQHYETAHI